jgi:hypothetical protein
MFVNFVSPILCYRVLQGPARPFGEKSAFRQAILELHTELVKEDDANTATLIVELPCQPVGTISVAAQKRLEFRVEKDATLPHFSVSSAMYFPKSAGEPTSAMPPKAASRAFGLASASITSMSRLSLSMTSAGVPFGAPTPYAQRSPHSVAPGRSIFARFQHGTWDEPHCTK